MSELEGLTITTDAGTLHGRADGRVRRWSGVPYAAAPVGALRLRAPRAHPGWSGVLDATTPGHAAPQPMHLPAAVAAPPDEDCLVLNVTAPREPGQGRPVLVWVHGGAFLNGAGSQYDTASLVADGDLIAVTVNYRLGALGFVDFRRVLGEPEVTNLGLRDQIAALRWVRDNIAAFGGDPDRITLAGESAGAVSTSLLLLVDEARSMLAGAILQSGTFTIAHPADLAAEVAERYIEQLEVRHGEQLRDLPVAALVDAQRAVARSMPGILSAAPCFDGDLLPASLSGALATPTPDVPLLAGTNRNELTLFAHLPVHPLPTRRSDLDRLVRTQLPETRAEEILSAYPTTRSGTSDLGTDLIFTAPMNHLAGRHARHTPTWLYEMDARNPVLGATHGIELVYLFDYPRWYQALWRGRSTPARDALARQMRTAWTTFIRDGDPGPGWSPPDEAGIRSRDFATDGRGPDHVVSYRRALWAGLDISPFPPHHPGRPRVPLVRADDAEG